MGVLVKVILLMMLIAAFVMGIVALVRNSGTDTKLFEPILVHPGAANVGSTSPTVSGTNFGSLAFSAGSTDTSGGVGGTTTAATQGTITVTFGTPYAIVPKAVLLTPTVVTGYTAALSVVALSTQSFTVQGTPAATVNPPSALPLFYYLVL